MPNYPNINKGQVGTANAGIPLTGMKPDMGGLMRKKKKPRKGAPAGPYPEDMMDDDLGMIMRKKKRKEKPMNAAVAAFKKQMRVR
jgi:hypothetical protein